MEHEYCWCKEDLGSVAMIECDNSECPNGEWFHFACLMLEEGDIPDGDWFCCTDCKKHQQSEYTLNMLNIKGC